MKIIKNGDYIGTDEGRLYLDGYSLKGVCPNCGHNYDFKLVRDLYFYDCLKSEESTNVDYYCSKCENEFSVKVELKVDIRIKL